jgi:hypothetical protein
VSGTAGIIKKVLAGSACGFRLASSRYDGRHSRALARLVLTDKATLESFGSKVNLSPVPLRWGEGGQRIGRHRGRSGVPSSDHESVRGRRGFGEGSPRSEKDHEEFASSDTEKVWVSGAPGRVRLKLAAANSSVDPPPSWPREWPGPQVRAPKTKRRWRRWATARSRSVLRGGHRAGIER